MRVAIVGAGITGISAAQRLQNEGVHVEVFDRGRAIGGRLASRHAGDNIWIDHGAPCVAATSEDFLTFLGEATGAGCAVSWLERRPRVAGSIIGAEKMPNLLSHAAKNLNIRLETHVTKIAQNGVGYNLYSEAEHLGSFDRVMCTAPPVTSHQLVGHLGDSFDEALAVKSRPTWTLIIAFPKRLPTSVVELEDEGLFSRIIRNSGRQTRNGEAFVAHASHEWTRQHFEEERDVIAEKLTEELGKVLRVDLPPTSYRAAHRWRYGQTAEPLGKPFLSNHDASVIVAADWCLGHCAEDGFEAGKAAVDHLVANMS